MPRLPKSKTLPVMSPRIAEIITELANSRSCASYLKQRSLVQVYATQGKTNKEIAELVELHPSHVGKWRTRFIEGLDRLKTIEKQHNELFAHPYGWNVDIDCLIEKVSKHIIKKESAAGESEEAG